VLHYGMPYDPIQGQGQGHGGLKIAKMSNFKVSAGMHVVKKVTVSCDSPRQYLNFSGQIFESRDLQS